VHFERVGREMMREVKQVGLCLRESPCHAIGSQG